MLSARKSFFSIVVALASCGTSGIPDPIEVMEHPTTGERVRFFPEIPYKAPSVYDESKHLAQWTATQIAAGFTREITPDDDREALAELRR